MDIIQISGIGNVRTSSRLLQQATRKSALMSLIILLENFVNSEFLKNGRMEQRYQLFPRTACKGTVR